MVLMKVLSLVLCSIAGGMRALVLQTSVRKGILNAAEAWGFGTSYLVVLAGCYLVTPFLYKIVEDDKLEKYFLILAMVFCWLIPSIVDLDYVTTAMPNVVVSVASWIDSAQIYIPVGSTMLYVLGHYIGKVSHRISKKSATVLLLISGLLWIAGNINNELYPDTISIFDVMRYGRYYGGYVSPIITFYAASVVIFFKVVIGDIYIGDNWAKIINHLGRNSAMIFLLHGIVIIIFPDIIPIFLVESYLVETIVNVTFYFIVCYILGMVLKIIPLIKRIVE